MSGNMVSRRVGPGGVLVSRPDHTPPEEDCNAFFRPEDIRSRDRLGSGGDLVVATRFHRAENLRHVGNVLAQRRLPAFEPCLTPIMP